MTQQHGTSSGDGPLDHLTLQQMASSWSCIGDRKDAAWRYRKQETQSHFLLELAGPLSMTSVPGRAVSPVTQSLPLGSTSERFHHYSHCHPGDQGSYPLVSDDAKTLNVLEFLFCRCS